MTNSRAKGANNERTVTKILQDWTGHEFTRVPASGGLQWKNKANICGDVISTDPAFDFIFSVETKFYKKLGLTTTKLRANSIIFHFMEQCQRDAAASGKKPFLIVRQNQMPKDLYYVFLPATFYQRVELMNYLPIRYSSKDDSIIGFFSDKFFEKVSYETIKRLYE